MRIDEIFDTVPYDKVADLSRECPRYTELDETLYRGTKQHVDGITKIKMSDSERSPVDTPLKIHQALNNLFRKYWGYPYRNGLFVTKDVDEASEYGTVYECAPTGNFNYVWAPGITDLYNVLTRSIKRLDFDTQDVSLKDVTKMAIYKNIPVKYRRSDTSLKQVPFEYLMPVLETMVKEEYIDTKIHRAEWHEIMIKCDSYYLIPTENRIRI